MNFIAPTPTIFGIEEIDGDITLAVFSVSPALATVTATQTLSRTETNISGYIEDGGKPTLNMEAPRSLQHVEWKSNP